MPDQPDRAATIEAALAAAHDVGCAPRMPAPLARLMARHDQEARDRRFAAAALTLAEMVEHVAVLAETNPWEALVGARAWALARLEQHGPICLPPAVARALLRGLAGTPEGAAGPDTGLGRARLRQAFRESVWTSGLVRVPILPLGMNCLPWNLPARWGFRAAPQAMEAFNPFALAAHRPEAVAEVLEQGWSGYAPTGRIRSIATPGGARVILRDDGGAVWNHHFGEHWQEQEFAALRLDMAVLARRFERVMAAPGPPLRIAFLVTTAAPTDAALARRLLAALRARMKGGRLGLFLLHNPPEGEAGPPVAPEPDIVALQVPQPRPDYQWHLPSHLDTPEGLGFEQRIMGALRDAAVGWGADCNGPAA